MSTEVQTITTASSAAVLAPPPLPILWRDPHTVPRETVAVYISQLKEACLENPQSADLRTCLGMAHAMNYDAYQAMDALEAARQVDPDHFWAQLKYAELQYRLRALYKAEDETLKALELATTQVEVAIARRQLAEIRRLKREGTQKPAWTKSLKTPALLLAALGLCSFLMVAFR
jgi:hypothetical protein